MEKFRYQIANSAQQAASLLSDRSYEETKIIAGGVDLVSELKENLIAPEMLISITDLDELNYIRSENGSTRIGASTRLIDIISDENTQSSHTALVEAASVVGSPQIRNVGTLGGNLCQRPRCWYYRGEFYKCLKKGGAICFSLTGRNKYNCILGGGPSYIVHPSDCAPALIALDATVRLQSPQEQRDMALEEFFTLPTEILLRENRLKPDEIVTEVEIPNHSYKSTYIKFRERDGYDWALSAVAAALELDGKTCKKANIILGGVAPIPWRASQAEELITGKEITEELAAQAGEAAVDGAAPMTDNAYKVPLTKALVKQALLQLTA